MFLGQKHPSQLNTYTYSIESEQTGRLWRGERFSLSPDVG